MSICNECRNNGKCDDRKTYCVNREINGEVVFNEGGSELLKRLKAFCKFEK